MIAIITYDAPHRKTQDLISKLLLNNDSTIHLVVIPWVKRKNHQPIFRHRPSKKTIITIEEMCMKLNLQYSKIEIEGLNEYFFKNSFDHILIGGAGILPKNVVNNHKIINCHPGYLPNTKGLDAFKWAIYHNQPIGVTSHYISDKADEGELIEKVIVPIYFEDTFHSVAYRVYETEIEILINAISQIENNNATLESLVDNNFVTNRRMPRHLETIMMNKFDELRKKADSFRKI